MRFLLVRLFRPLHPRQLFEASMKRAKYVTILQNCQQYVTWTLVPFLKSKLVFFSSPRRQARQEVMSIKDYNTLGVLCALCRRHHFASGEIQDHLLEMALVHVPVH